MKKKIIIITSIAVVTIAAIVATLLLCGKKVTITFDTDGGKSVAKITIKKGESIVLPKTEKEGFIFDGWYLKDERVSNAKTYDKDVTLKANWISETAKVFTVKFDSAGGSKVSDVIVECDKELYLPTTPTRSGYTFVSWVDKNDTPIYDKALLACEDITLTATWEKTQEKKETKKETKKDSSVAATGISLDKKTVDLVIEKSGKLTATVEPANATDKTVSWSSSNSDIVSVDQGGNIKANGIGSATITAKTSNGKTATATVYSDVSSISLAIDDDITYISNYGGTSSATVRVKTTPEIDPSQLKWNIQNKSKAIVSDPRTFVTITARDVSENSPVPISVTVSVGRKTSNKVTVNLEPKLTLTKANNTNYKVPEDEELRVNSNTPVKWSISGSVNITDIEKKDTYYIFSAGVNGTASKMMYVEAKSKAGQKAQVAYSVYALR